MYQAAYLKALEQNNIDMGIPFVDPGLPIYSPPPPREKSDEPDLPFLDRVYVNFRILKSGIVRIKIVPNFLIIYEQYHKRKARPPLKLVLQAYKARGFSNAFIEKVKRSEQRRLLFVKKVPAILAKIFDKEPVKKVKREKPPPPAPIEEDEPPKPQTTDEEEDCTMDVEPEEETEEPAEEEVYFSDEN
tara:strand:- start:237 stop:800 length:564 start_codon:yes stop_codon:yes gene_type:complete